MSVDQRELEWHVHLATRRPLGNSREAVLAEAALRADVNRDLLRAILLTEMVARPLPHRMAEFGVFLLALLLDPRKAARMTIGPGQVRVGSRAGGRLAILREAARLMWWSHSCTAAAAVLAPVAKADLDVVCRHYNGGASSENYRALVSRLAGIAPSGV